jgi:hypothetical protein
MIGSTAKVFTDIETNPGGYPVNATPTANNIPVLDANAKLPFTINTVKDTCVVIDTGTQSINNTTDTTLTWASETLDTNTMHDNSTNNSRITIKTAGKYLVNAQITFDTSATGRRVVKIQKNGSDYDGNVMDGGNFGASYTYIVNTQILDLAVNDYLTVVVYQSSGGALLVRGNISSFKAIWMSS